MRRRTLTLACVALLAVCSGRLAGAAPIATLDFTNSLPTFGTDFSNLSNDNNFEIRWGSIANVGGTDVDLVATVTGGTYSANNDGLGVALNGLSGAPGAPFRSGRINLRNDHAATFTFTLVDPNNGDNPVIADFHFSVLDIDSGPPAGSGGGEAAPGAGMESVQLISQNGAATWTTSASTELSSTYTPTTPAASWATPDTTDPTQPFFGADTPYENVPNPTDPFTLTPEQADRTVLFGFQDTSSFALRLAIGPGRQMGEVDFSDGGRNFLLTGAVPEPSTALMLTLGLAGLGMRRRVR